MLDIQTLKRHVTHFSEEIRLAGETGKEVIVGGTITDIYPIDNRFYCIVLDDFVGTIRVLISHNLFNHNRTLIQKNHVLFVNGFINIITRKREGAVDVDYSVVGYDVFLPEGDS